MVRNILILLHVLYYFSYFKLKKITGEKILITKLIQAFIKLNYDNEKVWWIYTFQHHPHYFPMFQNEHPLVGTT